MDLEDGAKLLCKYFASNKPFLIGRNGTIEIEYINNNTKKLADVLELHAGVFPSSHAESWSLDYLDALANTDVIAEGWYAPLKTIEKNILDTVNKYRKSILLRSLEPYYVMPELRWTQYLANKRVAIISSFASTCDEQTYMAKAIWSDSESLLPSSTTWIPIQTYYGPLLAHGKAEWPNSSNYKEAIEYVVENTLLQKPQVAIIGCGGLGMIIGSILKKAGVQCIVLGGAIQIMFGIKGKRWMNHDIISKFFNDAWVFPPDDCVPGFAKSIENGCYW